MTPLMIPSIPLIPLTLWMLLMIPSMIPPMSPIDPMTPTMIASIPTIPLTPWIQVIIPSTPAITLIP